jgi:hypothetical protein
MLYLRVNSNGLPLQIEVSVGHMHDALMVKAVISILPDGAEILADRGYDIDWISDLLEEQERIAIIPP